ncbi:MAG: serine/threonine-protein kinase, partial [Polyangiaceae bacterium]
PHLTLRLRRLRALLHLVDSDVGSLDDSARGARLRKRWFRIASALLSRVEADPPEALRRTLFAALARALDALVRADALDVADVLLVTVQSFKNAHELSTLAEASMDPDLIHVLQRYASFMTACAAAEARADAPVSSAYPSLRPMELAPISRRDGLLQPLEELARELIPHASSRGEALRTALVRLHAALKAVTGASSLRGLSSGGTEPDVVTSLEGALAALAQLTLGARGRLEIDQGSRGQSMPPSASSGKLLSVAVARVLSGAEPSLTVEMLKSCERELLADAPPAIALVVSAVLADLPNRPTERASDEAKQVMAMSEQLPAWVPPRRTLGGFYIVRTLGSGASGSVFVVNRVEDRHDADAEKFALKVPDYSATAARMLSEAEFLQMFRAEASALIAVPPHENLARFVTFDLAARPKPILVMELVEGSTLEHLVESRGLDMERCFAVLDDVLCGLEAMHGVGVGHLDVKPSNVVMRKGAEGVLVDFGLAGRHIRPGCGSGPYGAPEVWGAGSDETKSAPSSADIYSFGCLAFEALTGRLLFKADSEIAQIAAHITHDGFPPLLKALAGRVGLSPLAELLFSTLRRDPKNRPPVGALRSDLKKMAPQFTRLKWPLSV